MLLGGLKALGAVRFGLERAEPKRQLWVQPLASDRPVGREREEVPADAPDWTSAWAIECVVLCVDAAVGGIRDRHLG